MDALQDLLGFSDESPVGDLPVVGALGDMETLTMEGSEKNSSENELGSPATEALALTDLRALANESASSENSDIEPSMDSQPQSDSNVQMNVNISRHPRKTRKSQQTLP